MNIGYILNNMFEGLEGKLQFLKQHICVNTSFCVQGPKI